MLLLKILFKPINYLSQFMSGPQTFVYNLSIGLNRLILGDFAT
jgi:hypothetical protein